LLQALALRPANLKYRFYQVRWGLAPL